MKFAVPLSPGLCLSEIPSISSEVCIQYFFVDDLYVETYCMHVHLLKAAILYSAIQCSMIWYSAIQYYACVHYKTLQYDESQSLSCSVYSLSVSWWSRKASLSHLPWLTSYLVHHSYPCAETHFKFRSCPCSSILNSLWHGCSSFASLQSAFRIVLRISRRLLFCIVPCLKACRCNPCFMPFCFNTPLPIDTTA